MRIYDPDIREGEVSLAFSVDGVHFSPWIFPGLEAHGPDNGLFRVVTLQFPDAATRFVRYRIAGKRARVPVELHWFSPPAGLSGDKLELPRLSGDGDCPLPEYTTRTGWGCPTGQDFSNGDPTFTAVTHLAVHHSAGTNTSANWPGVVLSIWNHHVFTNAWADIGYNFLIDPNGVIYEGRGGNAGYTLDVLPAATCGSNSGTMAVCVLGNFEISEPAQAALESLEDLLAWKADAAGIAATGASSLNNYGTLDHIFGHRQGCATACPGANLYGALPQVRVAVAASVAASCLADCAPSADFSVTPESGAAPLTVTYTDVSAGADSRRWTFPSGQPSASTEAVVNVLYDSPGRYAASLAVFNECGSDSVYIEDAADVQTTLAVELSGAMPAVVYPNPATSAVAFRLLVPLESGRVRFVDHAGRQVASLPIESGRHEVSIDALHAGWYLLIIEDDQTGARWSASLLKR